MSITSVLYLKDEISIASAGAVDRLASAETKSCNQDLVQNIEIFLRYLCVFTSHILTCPVHQHR